MSCAKCGLVYPDELLNPLVGNFPESGQRVCGICALELTNQAHGIRRKRFDGEMAEDFRQRAINWRKKHPNAQPQKVQR